MNDARVDAWRAQREALDATRSQRFRDKAVEAVGADADEAMIVRVIAAMEWAQIQ